MTDNEIQTLCECCWKPIIGEQFTIDELTMCEDCIKIKELVNELELQRMEAYYDTEYYKKRLRQLKAELDEAENKLKTIEELLKK